MRRRMKPSLPIVTIRKNRAKPLRAGHPWVFSGAIAQAPMCEPGATVQVMCDDGGLIGTGYYNVHSQIAVRMWGPGKLTIDADFLRTRMQQAIRLRDAWGLSGSRVLPEVSACRLVNAESDRLPGLIVDRYGPYLVMQILTAGMECLKPMLVAVLRELLAPAGILERSDVKVRAKEGLAEVVQVHCGDIPEQVTIREGACEFLVQLQAGQKTGFFLDQRNARQQVAQVAQSLPAGARMLNAFAYSGGFGVAAAKANAHVNVLHIDVSADALQLAQRNAELNGVAARSTCQMGTAFTILRSLRDEAQQFDLIVVDPPKFVASKSQLNAGLRGYKDINMVALQLLAPDGYLATFSCSGLVSAQLFQQVVWEAATDAQIDCQIIDRFGHSADHPLLLSFPEGEYLKGLLIRKMS